MLRSSLVLTHCSIALNAGRTAHVTSGFFLHPRILVTTGAYLSANLGADGNWIYSLETHDMFNEDPKTYSPKTTLVLIAVNETHEVVQFVV